MRAKGLLLSAILICWLLGWSGIAECYDVYADSSGNVLNLRVNNTNSGFAMPGVVVKMIEKPSWVSNFSPGSQSLGNIAASGQGTASFTFNVNANTSVGSSGNIRFQVIATSGDSWDKDVSVKVVSSNGVITGNVTGATNVTITVTGPSSTSVNTGWFSGYKIEGLLPGEYTVTPTKDGYVSDPVNKNNVIVPVGGVVSGVDFRMIGKPDAPQLLSPGNNDTVNTLMLQFSWQSVSSASWYKIQISTDSNFWSAINDTAYSSWYSIWSLSNNTTYYWRVKAVNAAGESKDWSQTRSFKIKAVGTILGNVSASDQTFAGIGNALIEIIKNNTVITSVTTAWLWPWTGNYKITGLEPDTYDVRASKQGYQTKTEGWKNVSVGQDTTVNFILNPTSTRAAIRLSAPSSSSTIRNAPQYTRFAQAIQAKGLRSPSMGTETLLSEQVEEVVPVLRTGQIEVVIETTSPLTEAPVLSYIPVAGGSPEKVILTGNGSVWTGQIFVESITPEGTATFEYYGVDEYGSSSTDIDSGRNFEVDTTVLPDENTNVSNRDGTSVDVTKGVVDTSVNIQITDPDQTQQAGRQLAPVLASALSRRIAALEGTPLVEVSGATRHIEATIDGKGCRVSRANANFSFNIPYQDMDQDGIVDNTGIAETSLKAYFVDEQGNWQQSATSTINTEQNLVVVSHNLFTTYFLAGVKAITTIDNIACYPNPWYKDKDEYVNIGFIPLNSSPEVYLYNIAGELIRVLSSKDMIESNQGYLEARWDGKNEAGEVVSYGVYIYVIKCKQGERRGKIALIR